jgi:phosphopantetheinyl transferase (holo-ACP synthase)
MPAGPSHANETWLATPEVGREFEPERLDVADRLAWTWLKSTRRRRDWAVSRALLAAVAADAEHEVSLSHSHGYAALALAEKPVAVGVDVEWLAERDFRSLAEIAFTTDEARFLAELEGDDERRAAFYDLWTLKEAFAKALRLHLIEALGRCRVTCSHADWVAEIPTASYWRAVVYAPRPTLRLAVVQAAESPQMLEAPLRTLEWPPARDVEWRITRRLCGSGGAAPMRDTLPPAP